MRKTKNKIGISTYLKKHKFVIFIYILTVLLATTSSTVYTLVFANFLAKVTMGLFKDGIMLLAVAGVCLLITRSGWWINALLYYKYSNIIWKEIAKDLTSRSFQLATSTFSDNNSGTFVQRIMDDPESVISKLSSLIDTFANTISQVVIVIYIMSLHWIIALLYIIMLAISLVVELIRSKINKKNMLKTKEINDKTYSLVNEIVDSEKDIKALALEGKLFETVNTNFNKLQKQKYKENAVDYNIWITRNFVIEIFGLIILYLGIRMMEQNVLTLAAYILLYSYNDNLYGFVWNIGSIIKTFTEISVSKSRMFGLYDEDVYPVEKFGDYEMKNMVGQIEFESVNYAYTEVKDVEECEKKSKKKSKKKTVERIKKDPIFKELSFTIKPNTTVAFVGKSGSGKSTILSLISKLNDVDDGQVKIDGMNIKEINKESLRNNISLINQFPYIFDMSIKENLQLVKNDATDEEIWKVLKDASFDEDVKALPKGIDTKVGESGVKLSGGQRQRLAIARALLKQSKIILFDESTSSLDNFAQSNIQQSIENMKGQRTIIIVAHRLSTIKNVDKIYFLEDGKISADGTFDELFNTNKTFKTMFLAENLED